MEIGFIGVGRMGSPMARFLLQAGYAVTVCDPDPAACARARSHGAQEAGSIAECARGADVVFSSLPDDKILHQAALGVGGILSSARPGTIYVDTSTVSAEVSSEIATWPRWSSGGCTSGGCRSSGRTASPFAQSHH